MLRIVISLICFVAVPVLLFLAWSGWAKGVRAELPHWRNALCILALLLLLLNWLGAALLEVPVFVNPRMPRPAEMMEVMLTLSHPLGVLALVLAFAFRRVSRVQTVVAALLMLMSWPLGYV
jgi:hypothetical protein